MDAKAAARAIVDSARADLVALSHRIHAHPEIKWEEERSSAWVAEALAERGFAVDPPLDEASELVAREALAQDPLRELVHLDAVG